MNKIASKKILVDFTKAKKGTQYDDHYTLVTAKGVTIGFEAKVVDELPETGEKGFIYLVPKDESNPEDTYEEYVWALGKDGSYGWEHIGSTDVKIEIDDELSDTSENPVQNKVIKDALDNIPGPVIELTEGTNLYQLSAGTYYWDESISSSMVWCRSGGVPSMNTRIWPMYNACIVLPKGYNNGSRLIAFGRNPDSTDSILGGNTAMLSLIVDNSGTVLAWETVLTNGWVINDLVTTEQGHPLDARQGKVLNDKIGGDLSNLTTTDKSSLIGAINELVSDIGDIDTALQSILNGGES